MAMTIAIRGLSVGYGSKNVLSGIDLEIDEPGLYCIIGPNGVGKSTLVKCINGILEPSEGSVEIDGRDISQMSRREIAKKVAYVPVNAGDMFSMSVFDTVMLGRSGFQRWRTTKRDNLIVRKALEAVGMMDMAEEYFDALSAGQHQIVTIARGLVQETGIMVLDEPTSNLDLRYQIFVTSFLQRVAERKGMIVVMISHNINIASMFADRVIMLRPPGVMAAYGNVEEVLTEDNIRAVYGVNCRVAMNEGHPTVILSRELRISGPLPEYPP